MRIAKEPIPCRTVTRPTGFRTMHLKLPRRNILRNGLSRMTLRKLRRGTWPVQDSLDLHGNNTEAARKLLQQFLHEATGAQTCAACW